MYARIRGGASRAYHRERGGNTLSAQQKQKQQHGASRVAGAASPNDGVLLHRATQLLAHVLDTVDQINRAGAPPCTSDREKTVSGSGRTRAQAEHSSVTSDVVLMGMTEKLIVAVEELRRRECWEGRHSL